MRLRSQMIEASTDSTLGVEMRHYRINKVTEPGGAVLKKKDVLAASDEDALKRAEDSADCPVCDVLRDGERIGSVVDDEAPRSPGT